MYKRDLNFIEYFKALNQFLIQKNSHFFARMPRPTENQEKIKQPEEEKDDCNYKAKVSK